MRLFRASGRFGDKEPHANKAGRAKGQNWPIAAANLIFGAEFVGSRHGFVDSDLARDEFAIRDTKRQNPSQRLDQRGRSSQYH